LLFYFFFSSRRRHTRSYGDWSSDVCSSDLVSRTLLGRSLQAPSNLPDYRLLPSNFRDTSTLAPPLDPAGAGAAVTMDCAGILSRSEERRVGKECVLWRWRYVDSENSTEHTS